MASCRYCGQELRTDARFCDKCGVSIKDSSNAPQANADQGKPVSVHAADVRCFNCGAVGPAGGECPSCLRPLRSKEEYEAKLREYRQVQAIQRKYNPGKILAIFLLIIALGLLLYFLLPDGFRDETLVGLVTMGHLLIGLFSLLAAVVLFGSLASRSSRIKRTGMTMARFMVAVQELRYLPAGLAPSVSLPAVSQTTGGQRPADGKKRDKKYNRVMAAILIPIFLLVGWMGYRYAVTYAGLEPISFGGGGDSLTGRWEATSGGDFDPAIVFRNGKAYFGYICFSDQEIIDDVGGVRQKSDRNGVTYTLTGDSITFHSNTGTSTTYKRDGNTINFGPATMKKVKD